MVFMLSNVFAQEVTKQDFEKLVNLVKSLENDRDTLKNNYYSLELKRVTLEKKLLTMNKTSFKEMKTIVKEAFDKTDVISLSATYQEVIKSSLLLHNKITTVNNFTDAEQVFGFNFEKEMLNIAETTLVENIIKVSENESQEVLSTRKEKFREVIKVIVENPIIEGFLRSNPITSVAHSIINQTISTQGTQIKDVKTTRGDYQMPASYRDFKKNYPSFKASYETSSLVGLPESKRLILDSSIETFTKKLKPLRKLFDDLSKINEKYESSLKVFMKASEQTIIRAEPIEKEFYKKLGVEERKEANEKIDDFFNVGESPSLELIESKLQNSEMKNVLDYAGEVNEVYILLKNDFLKIISLEIELANEYITFFEELKNGKDGMPKFDDIEILENNIKEFKDIKTNLESQKNKLEKQ